MEGPPGAADLAASLQAAVGALELLKATLQQNPGQSVPAAPIPATFGDVIANLTTELTRMAERAPQQAVKVQAEVDTEVAEPAPQIEAVASQSRVPAPGAPSEDKLIAIPTRQRSLRRGGSAGEDAAAAAPKASKTVLLELPATPFHMRAGAVADAAPASQAPQPTPGMPANTPMAAEVLASLCALGLTLPIVQAPGHAAGDAPPRRAAAIAAAAAAAAAAATSPDFVPSRRSAAVRAAQATAGLVSRPRKPVYSAAAAQADPDRPRTCNCKRSQCLKLYCDCFAAGGFCLPSCTCLNCVNTENSSDAVQSARISILSKDPTAFDNKVSKGEGHKKGCRCKRSKCLKKYCECYNAGVKCNPEVCQCEGCKNCTDGGVLPVAVAVQERMEEEFDDFKSPGKRLASTLLALGDENTRANARVEAQSKEAAPAVTAAAAPANRTGRIVSVANLVPAGGFASPPPALPPRGQQEGAAVAAAGPASLSLPQQQVQEPQQAGQRHLPQGPSQESEFDAPAEQINALCASQAGATETAPAGAPAVTPAVGGGALRGGAVGPSALMCHLSDMGVDSDAEVSDSATSPAVAGAASAPAALPLQRTNSQTGHRSAHGAATMTRGPKTAAPARLAAAAVGPLDGDPVPQTEPTWVGNKRPRRAASGGVQSALAAATSDWGLDVVSPPHKRAHSMPDDANNAAPANSAGNNAGKRDRNRSLLRQALHHEATAAAAATAAAGDEADAISALVSLNSQG